MTEVSIKNEQQIIESTSSSDRIYFQLIKKVGSMGRYQKITIFLWSLISYLTGGLMLIAPLLFFQDPYDCSHETQGQTCLDYVCSLPSGERLLYIPPASMKTLANLFGDYRCGADALYLNIIQSIMYSSAIVGYLAMALAGGHLSRKFLMLGSVILSAFGFLLTVFSVSIEMAGAGLFLSSFGIIIAFNGCFLYIYETVAEEYRVKISVLIQFFYGVGVLANVGTYYLIGDWKLIFILFYLVPLAITILGIIFVVKDTPIGLVTRLHPEKALKQFLKIAAINKLQNPSLSVEEIQRIKEGEGIKTQQQQSKRKFSVIDLFKYKSLRAMTLLLVVLLCSVTIQFYGPVLMMENFHLNIFINGLVLGVAEIFAYPFCYFIITRVPRRALAFGCFTISLVCSIILIFIWAPQNASAGLAHNIGTLVVVFFFRFATTIEYTVFYIYFNELYPTQIRTIGTGFVSMMGGAMIMVNPEIITACQTSGLHIMILFAVVSAVSLFCSYFLPETFDKVPQDIIDELKETVDNPEIDKRTQGRMITAITLNGAEQSAEPSPIKVNQLLEVKE